MWVNASSNASLLTPHHCLPNSSNYPVVFTCSINSNSTTIIFITFTITNVLLLLPLYILILWMGFRRWRHQRCVTTGTTSHSDVITYHIVTTEITAVLGMVFFCGAIYTCSEWMMMVGYYSLNFTYPAQTFFHCLTCVERYLAVVHPITYLGLRKAGGLKVRNIALSCVWLLSFGMAGSSALNYPDFPQTQCYVFIILSLSVFSFCSLSALCGLIRLGPGKVGGGRERIDQSKKRAFLTIMAIMGTILLRFCGLLVSNIMFSKETRVGKSGCEVLIAGFWFCLPSSLVLPLLFLHKAGTLACCRRSTSQTKEN